MPFVFPPSAALAAFLNKPSSLLCAAFLIEAAGLTPKAEFYGREGFNKNLAMRNLIKYCKRRGLLIELGGEAILVIRSEQRAIERSTGNLTIGHECPEVFIVYSRGSEGGGGRRGTLGGIFQQQIPHTDKGAYQKDTLKASGSRCCDNLYQVRTIIDHQIRWSAIFTPAHKHKSSARNIIPKYPKDSNIVNQEGGKTLAEFPNSIELGKLGPGQDPNNDGALHYMFKKSFSCE
ncbi:hypothetical protein Cni_G16817 [Canna indica]|uniref:Uncharacterized protein n=1 Tax=Canna indica TaxID=4628 RepID=A0AAQ3KFX4_9LILI|nr:hypothetical protein Cni_G16817 [Canna indica]